MKHLVRSSAVALALAAAAPATAQQTSASAGTARTTMVGVGVGVTAAQPTGAPDFGTWLYVPIQLQQNLRIEPFVGWARSRIDDPPRRVNQPTLPDFTPDIAFEPGENQGFGGKSSDFTLGVGGFFVQPVAPQLQLYVGARLGSQWQSVKDNAGTFKATRRNNLLGASLGGEYLPVPRVALGAEVALVYVGYGDTKFTVGGQSGEGAGGSGDATIATVFARFFLF